VQTSKRSPWTNREKEIDTTLVADAVEDIVKRKDETDSNRSVILFTGDKDMIVVVKKAIENDWNVEIWTYKNAISNSFFKEAKLFERHTTIVYIDDIFNDISYIESSWRKPIVPAERTIVLM
jgi:hypothetical protein